jgi:uncharacterized membrane protein YcaP (DUF421 family)
MDSVLRGLAVYVILLVVFRISGKRTLAEVTTFDFVLLLIIAEVTQQALLGQDYSITNFVILVVTLLGFDILLSLVKQRWPRLDRLMEGRPLIIVEDGRPLRDRMNKARVDEEDILSSARQLHGLERMEQVKYAVLERNGHITIVPKAQ